MSDRRGGWRGRGSKPLPSELVRVTVSLERRALEDLELIVAHRHGARSRSAVVREAIGWLLAKEAAWLLRARSQADRRQREADALERARKRSGEQRRREAAAEQVRRAVQLIRRDDGS